MAGAPPERGRPLGSIDFTRTCSEKACTGTGLSDFDTGVTGLALLAFLGNGHTPQNRAGHLDPVTGRPVVWGETVKRGLKWLVEHQGPDGLLGPSVPELMYNHAIATYALSEAYAITNSAAYKKPAQLAVDYLDAAQNYGLGWRYTAKCGSNDTSITGWCVFALKSARVAGLDVPKTTFDGALGWVRKVTDKSGVTGYDKLGSGELFVPGKNESWQHHPTMTAVGVLSRILVEKEKKDADLSNGVKALLADLPKWDPGAARPTVDFYYWHHGTNAVFQYGALDAKAWDAWNGAMKKALVDHQRGVADGCAAGSWDSDGVDRWAYAGGRVTATALNVLTLEVYYRESRVFEKRKKK